MTGRSLGDGKTVQVMIYLDLESRRSLQKLPQGFGGAYVRKAVAAFVDWLKVAPTPPPQIPSGASETPFSMKAPEDLLEKAGAYVGRGAPYTTMSGLVRTAIHWKEKEA
jgi:hypothetical protein